MKAMYGRMSTAARTVMAVSLLLLLFVVCGGFSASSDVVLTYDEAVAVALPHIDFTPTESGARLVRQGFSNRPVWAVVFEVPGSGEFEYEELIMIEVDARTGEIIGTRTKEQLGY